LGAQAALEVATATMIEQLAKLDTPKVTKALRCQKAEHTFAGMPCGIMDQYVSAMGAHSRLLLIDCRSNECELIPFGVEASSETYKLVVANSNVKHKLSDSEYPVRVAQCKEAVRALQSAYPAIEALRDATLEQLEAVRSSMSDVAYKRAKHNITENARTQAAVEALKNANFVDVGKNMTESHVSLRDDYEVSCPELDALVDIAVSVPGVLGSRMTGGGFGGCTITLVEANAVDALLQALHSEYPKRSGHDTTTFVVSPSAGAGVV
jgi:galactokinase